MARFANGRVNVDQIRKATFTHNSLGYQFVDIVWANGDQESITYRPNAAHGSDDYHNEQLVEGIRQSIHRGGQLVPAQQPGYEVIAFECALVDDTGAEVDLAALDIAGCMDRSPVIAWEISEQLWQVAVGVKHRSDWALFYGAKDDRFVASALICPDGRVMDEGETWTNLDMWKEALKRKIGDKARDYQRKLGRPTVIEGGGGGR
jgi:hypothetical protein